MYVWVCESVRESERERERVRVCVCVRARVRACVRTCVRARACVCALGERASERERKCVCVRARARARVCVGQVGWGGGGGACERVCMGWGWGAVLLHKIQVTSKNSNTTTFLVSQETTECRGPGNADPGTCCANNTTQDPTRVPQWNQTPASTHVQLHLGRSFVNMWLWEHPPPISCEGHKELPRAPTLPYHVRKKNPKKRTGDKISSSRFYIRWRT